jgi:hypothetical protein
MLKLLITITLIFLTIHFIQCSYCPIENYKESSCGWNSTTQKWIGIIGIDKKSNGSWALGTIIKQCHALSTDNDNITLLMQPNGNLVLYIYINKTQIPIWQTNTSGKSSGPYQAEYKKGNLVVLDGKMKSIWSSETSQYMSDRLQLNANGTMSIYHNINPIWISNSNNLTASYGNTGLWHTKILKTSKLEKTMSIKEGQAITNGKYTLVLQLDGNLVLYSFDKNTQVPMWQSKSSGHAQGPFTLTNHSSTGQFTITGTQLDLLGHKTANEIVIWSGIDDKMSKPNSTLVLTNKGELQVIDSTGKLVKYLNPLL